MFWYFIERIDVVFYSNCCIFATKDMSVAIVVMFDSPSLVFSFSGS